MTHLVPISDATKTCPRCAEEIKLRATGCRFCGADFTLATRGYCTRCHRVVTVDGAATTCPSCGDELVDLMIDTELVDSAPPLLEPPRFVPPPPSGTSAAVPTAPPVSIREPVGRVRRAVATSTRQQLGFQLATMAAAVLALLPVLGIAVESLRIWQRDVGYAREYRTLGPLFLVLGIALVLAAPRPILPITIGGSRWRAKLGGRRTWARRLKERTGTRLLLARAGLPLRIVLSGVGWVASGLLFQAAFGAEFDEPGVERLPGATVTVVVILVGLAGTLLVIPGSKARMFEVDDEGEILDQPPPPQDTVARSSPPRAGALPYLVAGIAVLGLAAASFLLMARDGDDEGQTTPTSAPTAAENVPSDDPGATSAAPVEPADDADAGTVPAEPAAPNPATPAATGGADDVTLVSSNAIVEESTFTIDGESRYLYLFAELRNDGPDRVRIAEATITIRDASGQVIGTRLAYPVDQVLEPGEVTFVEESMPSLTYWEGETNTFPEGWAAWDLHFDVEAGYQPTAWDEVHLLVGDLIVAPDGSGISATGTVTNATATPVYGNIEVSVAVIGPDGQLLVVGWTLATTTDGSDLEAGGSIAFEIHMSHDISLAGASYVVAALATPAT